MIFYILLCVAIISTSKINLENRFIRESPPYDMRDHPGMIRNYINQFLNPISVIILCSVLLIHRKPITIYYRRLRFRRLQDLYSQYCKRIWFRRRSELHDNCTKHQSNYPLEGMVSNKISMHERICTGRKTQIYLHQRELDFSGWHQSKLRS